jgi:hypothetical protein
MTMPATITWTVNTDKGSLTVTKVTDLKNAINTFIANVVDKTGDTMTGDLDMGSGNAMLSDTISESTPTAGVTVDGVLLKDGNVDGRDVSEDGTTLDNLLQCAGMMRESGGPQNIPTGTWTKLDWTAALFSDTGIVSDPTTDDDFTIALSGTYEMSVWVSCLSVLVEPLRLGFDKNGLGTYTTSYKNLSPVSSSAHIYHATFVVELAASDTISAWLRHNEGADRGFMGLTGNQVWVKRLG